MLKVRLDKINLKSGETLEVADGITVIVGPNNAGKSLILRELASWLSSDSYLNPAQFTAISEVSGELLENDSDLLSRLRREYAPFQQPSQQYDPTGPMIRIDGDVRLYETSIPGFWSPQLRFAQLAGIYFLHFTADSRTNTISDVQMYDQLDGMPTQPLQKLFAAPRLEDQLNEVVQRAFGQKVSVNRSRGTIISLHVGQPTTAATWPPTPEYLAEMKLLPLVGQQGDGMRSFIGIALNIIAGNRTLLLVDEPEAFLHPPQARELGRLLVRLRQAGTQIIVATHSSDIIQGITSETRASTAVQITRLSRNNQGNHVAAIPAKAVQNLYTDPLLKYSSVLDGLFYHGVVVCESEGDCTYYTAVLDGLPDSENGRRVDIHFTHCSGKDRIPQAVEALRAAKVPVASVFDIDLLQNRSKLEEVIKAHGVDPMPLLTGLNTISSQVNEGTQRVKRDVARAAVTAALDGSRAPELTPREAKAIREAVKETTGWSLFKKMGRSRLSGEALRRLDSLLAELAKIGIFLVPVGELERFHPEYTVGNKAKWLQEVLSESVYARSGSQDAFVASIRAFIEEQQ